MFWVDIFGCFLCLNKLSFGVQKFESHIPRVPFFFFRFLPGDCRISESKISLKEMHQPGHSAFWPL